MAVAVANIMRKPPPPSAFFTPAGLSDFSFLKLLAATAGDIVSADSGEMPRYQRRNARCLVRRIRTLLVLIEFLIETRRPLPSSAVLCFKELYIVVHRARILLEYCLQSSRLWLLLRNREISGYFQDLEREISTLLDVLPLSDFCLNADVREHVELLRRQVGNSRIYVNYEDEELWIQVLSFLEDFGKGRIPDVSDLKSTFTDRIGMMEARDFESEIEFLQNQIISHEGAVDTEADLATIDGVIAVVRYSRFSLFGAQEVKESNKRTTRRPLPLPVRDISALPKDFCCPISLELMRDPVVVPTGQTYDRHFITQWIAGGHQTCPNSGQNLGNAVLIPNRAIRSVISHWCAANGVASNSHASGGISASASTASKAALEANRATICILVHHLSTGENASKATAARELRMLAKIGKENRAMIGAEEKAISFLNLLLRSPNPTAQENAVTALLNLSINDANKTRIITQPGCLRSIIRVLRFGLTPESKENAAATLFSLSAIQEYKKRVVEEPGGVEALVWLLKKGRLRGKRDAVVALFNLSTHPESWERMVGSGAVAALVGAVAEEDGVAEEAAGALALLARQPVVAGMVGWEERAVAGLASVMRVGSERGRENATAALHEICRRGGAEVAERVARVPGVARVVQTVAVEGTKRARRKAAALARLLQRREWRPMPLPAPASASGWRGAGWGVETTGEMSPVAFPVAVL
ncbi:hypothetical protein M5K25_028441 [Dendrobium thyrsiflorum]|uniref:RING-type E3 ubiquitin transferase n=1 Tax=Dendrobium thyrsiflorum TaxID=117978 RepID=A0ABD0TT99_DENTH